MNGTTSHPPALTPPTNIHEAKLQNRLNIEACQTLIEIQSQTENPLHDSAPMDNNLMGKLKIAINRWLANSEIKDPPPPNSTICGITEYRNKKLLIETNSHKATIWLKANATQILQPLLGHLIKVLDRLYQVVARFMPVQFQMNAEGIRKLEISANLPADSISHVTWLKNPEHRSPSQSCANVKIHCSSTMDANTLILGSGHISHMGSQLHIHKEIRTPRTCNRCQRYSHFTQDCKEESSTCAKCSKAHRTMECTTRRTKCTPCGSTDHQTNNEKCTKRIKHKNATIDKKPEALTPYYITDEQWTWGLCDNVQLNQTQDVECIQSACRPNVINTCFRCTHAQSNSRPFQQHTLTSSGFQHKPLQTGTNNTPLGHRVPHDTPSPALSPPHQPSPTDQQTSGNQNEQATQPTSFHP